LPCWKRHAGRSATQDDEGRQWQQFYLIEALNSKLRSECLNAHWFLSLEDACEKLGAWRRHYSEERPHSAIGNIPPIMLANSAGETSPPDLSKAANSRPERSKVG
jgi:putative transposase